jgi:hypothetical protein
MGAGIAKAIADRWPRVKDEYLFRVKSVGLIEPKEILIGEWIFTPINKEGTEFVISIFGQKNYGRQNARYTSYDALDQAFHDIDFTFSGKKIAIPYGIGCVIGGGNWNVVYQLIKERFVKCDVLIYKMR